MMTESNRSCPDRSARRAASVSRGSALLELAIFGAIAIGTVGFFLRALAMQYGTIRATQQAFRLCLAHAGSDNGAYPYEARAVQGFAQLAVPQVSLGSWEVGAAEGRGSCFVEWGRNLTMSAAVSECENGKGNPFVAAYSGPNGITYYQHQQCEDGAIDETTVVSATTDSTVTQDSGNQVTNANATFSGGATLSFTGPGGGASHGVGYGPVSVDGSTNVRTP